ncbi:MAG: Outer-membrane lipoprotein carrier protein [Alphaproteobacteria bacterium MarineAlpha2_Bin1]|nr:MAG: Outer-membrane lipoprotein carrier protein [Alphaproteobacteria bacterium MarineAlpha2_Bin1]
MLANLKISLLLVPLFLFFSSSSFSKNSEQIINEIESYFNNINTLQAKFIQLDENGIYKSGTLMVAKPGKIRFDYNKPSSVLIVSDGEYVIFYDKKVEQLNRIHINKIPIQFLLTNNFSFKKNNILIKNIQFEGNVITLSIQYDKNVLTNKIKLLFESNPLILRQWIVEDSQGYKTRISLEDINTDIKLDEKKFKFDYNRKFREINKTFLPN